jgi:hypothetical protein
MIQSIEPSHNTGPNDPRTRASKSLDAAIAIVRRFPENVFLGEWSAYLFFDPDLIFDRGFIEIAKALLLCEDGTCICLRNLEVALTGNLEQASLFLDNQSSGKAYMGRLSAPIEGSNLVGWVHLMDHYGCASDIGSWCIYCERSNEIAVIAVRKDDDLVQLSPALKQLQALPIREAIERPSSYGLSVRGMSANTRAKLIQEYDLR